MIVGVGIDGRGRRVGGRRAGVGGNFVGPEWVGGRLGVGGEGRTGVSASADASLSGNGSLVESMLSGSMVSIAASSAAAASGSMGRSRAMRAGRGSGSKRICGSSMSRISDSGGS
ncbi:hypothetical protein [Rhodanobacter lindaniclasticus]